jgi:hypothetical protein
MIATASRRPRYHTARSSSPWLVALRRLWALGLTDARVAGILTGLTAAAIGSLERRGWTVERAEDLAAEVTPPDLPRWTARQVCYHRHRLGLAARSDGLREGRAELDHRRRRYQCDCGWGHLLPGPRARSGRRAAGVCLRRREVDVLSLLRDRGPMTRRALCALMGLRRLMARGRSMFARLVRLGLVRVQRETGMTLVFALGEAARCPHEEAGGPRPYEPDEGADFG